MAKYLKFIMTPDHELSGGLVEFHADILPKEKRYSRNACIGGGFFKVNEDEKEITLYGSSSDFGKCSTKDLQKAIDMHGNDFKSNLWMIMYLYYRMQGNKVNSDDLDYMDYKITIEDK